MTEKISFREDNNKLNTEGYVRICQEREMKVGMRVEDNNDELKVVTLLLTATLTFSGYRSHHICF